MPSTPPIILSIAGFDPSSGAGVTADIKTIAAHGCYGVAAITALTVQSTSGVARVEPVSAALLTGTLNELAQDVDIAAIRIGMLGSAEVAAAVASFLEKGKFSNVVLDPILKSSSGAKLLEDKALKLLCDRLLPLVTIITPNFEEALALTRMSGGNGDYPNQARALAVRLHEMGCPNVVITGGHLDKASDFLGFQTSQGGLEFEMFSSEKQKTKSTHGTGCAFATALACHLALGRQVPEAVLLTKAYVTAAIAAAYPLGRGNGPLHHLYRMHEQRRRAASTEPEIAH